MSKKNKSSLRWDIAWNGRCPALFYGLLVLVAALPSGCGKTPLDTPVAPESPAHTVTKITEDGLREILEGLKGKPYVVNVWATWCMPCVEELPEFIKFYEAHQSGDIGFVSLSADLHYEFEETVVPFVAEHRLPFPVWVQHGVPPETLIALLDVAGTKWDGPLPATFVFDSAGNLVKFWQERVTFDLLEKTISDLP